MITLEYYTEFTEEEQETLRSQNVCLDDWDYAFISYDCSEFEERLAWDGSEVLYPKNEAMERIMTGSYANTWYKINWKGREAIIGFAYHG